MLLLVALSLGLFKALSQPAIPIVAQTPIGQFFNFNGSTILNEGLCNTDGSDFSYREELDFTSNTRTIYTSGCPNHFSACQFSNCDRNVSIAIKRQMKLVLPLYPQIAVEPKDVTCGIFDTGIALNGVVIRSIGETGGKFICVPPTRLIQPSEKVLYREGMTRVASVLGLGSAKKCSLWGDMDAVKDCGNVIPSEGIYYDKCGGRVDELGVYNYKTLPSCLLKQLEALRVNDEVISRTTNDHSGMPSPGINATVVSRGGLHSIQIGWAVDGFPVYGPLGPEGKPMLPCDLATSDPVFCLDRCGGYMGEMRYVDAFTYRYYMPGIPATSQCSDFVKNSGPCNRNDNKCCSSSIPEVSNAPYAIACLVGCTYSDLNCVPSDVSGTTPFYDPYPLGRNLGVLKDIDTFSAVPAIPTSYEQEELKNGILNKSLVDAFEAQASLVSSVTGEQLTFFRFLHNRTLAVMKVATEDNHSHNPGIQKLVSALNYRISLDGTTMNTEILPANNSFISPGTRVDLLPYSEDDVYMNGMTQHNDDLSYITLQDSIVSLNLTSPTVFSNVITSLVFVTINGYNLGYKPSDVLAVQLGGFDADRIDWIGSEQVRAIFTRILNNNVFSLNSVNKETMSGFSAADVYISTIGGSMLGPNLQPLTILRSNSKRPVISSASVSFKDLHPHAIFAASSSWLYFSNLAPQYSGLFRCRVDGSIPEPLLLNRERIYAVNSVPLPDKSKDMVFYADAAIGGLFLLTTPTSSAMKFDFETGDTPLMEDNTEILILSDLLEPTAIAFENFTNLLYIVTREGALYELDVAVLTKIVIESISSRQLSSMQHLGQESLAALTSVKSKSELPSWIRCISLSLSSRTRISGIVVLPRLQDVLKVQCDLRYSRLDVLSAWSQR